MKTRHHLSLFFICVIIWFLFYLGGLSYNYYQDFSSEALFLLLMITFGAIIPVISSIALIFIKLPFLRTSIWLAFYASVPLFIFDYIFVGLVKGEGLSFLVSHWYLTLGYIAVWIELPIIGKTLEEFSIRIFNQNL